MKRFQSAFAAPSGFVVAANGNKAGRPGEARANDMVAKTTPQHQIAAPRRPGPRSLRPMDMTRMICPVLRPIGHLVFAGLLAGSVGIGTAVAQTAATADVAKTTDGKPVDAKKKPSKAELGEMLKKCSEEADAKGLTIQKGKGEARNSYRRACMLKNGVAPRKK